MGNESSAPNTNKVITKTIVKTVYRDRPHLASKSAPTMPPQTPQAPLAPQAPQTQHNPPPYAPPPQSQISVRDFDTSVIQRNTRVDTRLPTAPMTTFRDNPVTSAPPSYIPNITKIRPQKKQAVTVNLMPPQAPQAPPSATSTTLNATKDDTDKFGPAMRSFLQEYDPYKLLKVERTDDLKTVKASYRKLATKYHPDKGGNQDIFDKITKAYTYLKSVASIANVKTPTQDHTSLRRQAQDVNQPSSSVRQLHTDNFNIAQFNTQFSQNKLGDDSVDHGYSEFMTTDSRDADTNPDKADLRVPNTHGNSGAPKLNKYDSKTKFNLDVFNDEFKDDFTLTKHIILNPELPESEQSVQVYQEPLAFTSGAQTYSDIDRQRAGDYTSFNDPLSASNSQQYSDYMSAFTTRSTFTNSTDDSQSRKDFTNLDDLKRNRANVSYEMSAGDKEKVAEQEQKMAAAENERLRRISERDNVYEEHNTHVSRQFLGN